MQRQSFLVTVYFDETGNDKFIVDNNDLTPDEYDYELCITKVIDNHLKQVNKNSVIVVDVCLDKEPKRIIKLMKRRK
jgi:hypothetical protein